MGRQWVSASLCLRVNGSVFITSHCPSANPFPLSHSPSLSLYPSNSAGFIGIGTIIIPLSPRIVPFLIVPFLPESPFYTSPKRLARLSAIHAELCTRLWLHPRYPQACKIFTRSWKTTAVAFHPNMVTCRRLDNLLTASTCNKPTCSYRMHPVVVLSHSSNETTVRKVHATVAWQHWIWTHRETATRRHWGCCCL